jgi:hypothetical protein
MTGADPIDDGRWLLRPDADPTVPASYAAGADAVQVTVTDAGDGSGGAFVPADGPVRYEPGEEYSYLGGTDAVGGERLYLAGRAPSRLTVLLRRC